MSLVRRIGRGLKVTPENILVADIGIGSDQLARGELLPGDNPIDTSDAENGNTLIFSASLGRFVVAGSGGIDLSSDFAWSGQHHWTQDLDLAWIDPSSGAIGIVVDDAVANTPGGKLRDLAGAAGDGATGAASLRRGGDRIVGAGAGGDATATGFYGGNGGDVRLVPGAAGAAVDVEKYGSAGQIYADGIFNATTDMAVAGELSVAQAATLFAVLTGDFDTSVTETSRNSFGQPTTSHGLIDAAIVQTKLTGSSLAVNDGASVRFQTLGGGPYEAGLLGYLWTSVTAGSEESAFVAHAYNPTADALVEVFRAHGNQSLGIGTTSDPGAGNLGLASGGNICVPGNAGLAFYPNAVFANNLLFIALGIAYNVPSGAYVTGTTINETSLVEWPFDTSGGDLTATLPARSSVTNGRVFRIRKVSTDANKLNVAPDGTDMIDGVNATVWSSTSYAFFEIEAGYDNTATACWVINVKK